MDSYNLGLEIKQVIVQVHTTANDEDTASYNL